MNGTSATCWKCGAGQTGILLPLSRTEACGTCGADLHVCRMCRFYDTSVANACREPVAERVTDKTRANFCGYLELRTDAGTHSASSAGESADLNALFGIDEADQGKQLPTLDDLFGDAPKSDD